MTTTETLVSKIKNGDMQTLRIVYELFYKPVYQAAYYVIKDPSLAEDVVHESFLKMKYKIDQLQDSSKLEAWLCRIATNIARDLIRRRLRNTFYMETRNVYPNNQPLSPETSLLQEEDKIMIKQKIKCLNPSYRQILYLKYYREMSCEEISTALNLPVGTVKSRLFNARQKIRKLIELDNENIAIN